jgi:hypothetical protein
MSVRTTSYLHDRGTCSMLTIRQSTTCTVLCVNPNSVGFKQRIWLELKNAHAGNADVQARLYATYRREYDNFTHLPGESIDALFQQFTIVNNMWANVDVLPYDGHDIAVKLLHALDTTVWECETWVPLGLHRPGLRPSPTSRSDLPEDPPTCQWAQPT